MAMSAETDKMIGPKDRCPCGSGRKYKKCCGISAAANREEQLERNYALFRRTEARVTKKAIELLGSLGKDAFDEAWELFSMGMPEAADAKEADGIGQMFASWLLFDYPGFERNKKRGGRGAKADSRFVSFAELLLLGMEEFGVRREEALFLEAGRKTRFSWYEVESIRPGTGVEIRDLLGEEQFEVREHTGSMVLRPGLCFLGRAIEVFGVRGFFGMYPKLVPPQAMPALLDARDELPRFMKGIRRDEPGMQEENAREIAVRALFVTVAEKCFAASRKGIQIMNTDGDPLELLELEWALDGTVRDAVNRLQPLIEETGRRQSDEVLEQVSRMEPGQDEVAHFSWSKSGNKHHKDWESTLLAHFEIRPGKITVAVNSRKRADAVQARVTELLGDKIQFRGIRDAKEPVSKGERAEGALTQAELEQLPEVQAKVKEMAEAHWEAWFGTPIPMLDDQTPRQACQSERGRELLKALFHHYESTQAASGVQNLFNPDISALKARLGLEGLQ
jgi:hypothetical protein